MSLIEFRQMTRKTPFEPFRIEASNGQTYDVRHPDMVLATATSVAVCDEIDELHLIAMEHVVALHPLSAKKGG